VVPLIDTGILLYYNSYLLVDEADDRGLDTDADGVAELKVLLVETGSKHGRHKEHGGIEISLPLFDRRIRRVVDQKAVTKHHQS